MIDLSHRIANLSPEQRELLRQELKSRNGHATRPQIGPQKRATHTFPLSFAQQRLWFLDQMEPGSSIYNIPAAMRLSGPLNVAALEGSFYEILKRHQALRTTFATVDGQPLQVISALKPFTLTRIDLQELLQAERDSQIEQLMLDEAQRPFNLALGPLLRATLIQLDSQEHVLLLTIHHIVSDGWSMSILFRELSALYKAFVRGKPASLPELPIQYTDFAVWQRQWLQGETLAAQLAYWKKQLNRAPSILALPTDRPRSVQQTHRSASQTVALSKTLTEGLKTLSQQAGASLFMTLLAAFKALLYHYTGQDDIVIGTPIANRNRVEIEPLIGFFVNTLVLRTDLSGDPTFRELLSRVREVALEAYTHQDLPFEKLVEELQPERDLSHTPLFQVWFVLQNTPGQPLDLLDLTVSPLEIKPETAKFDLTLTMREREQGLAGTFSYNTDLFDPTTIEQLGWHFQNLLEGIVTDARPRLSNLPLLPVSERSGRPGRGNLIHPTNPFIEFKQEEIEQSISDRFEQQVQKYPSKIAVKTSQEEWTYAALNQAVQRVARTLLARCGPGPERIALLFEHGAAMLVGLLGVLKAGKTYVPLDPTYPADRLAYIVSDSRAGALLTNTMNRALAKELTQATLPLINIQELEEPVAAEAINLPISPDTVAYLLYTSGSTGQPKGVMQNHRNVLHHIRNYTNNLHLSSEDKLTLLSSYGFDAAVMDIFGALLNGATLYPISIKEEGFTALSHQLVEQKITIYHSTPTVFRYFAGSLADEKTFPHTRLVVLGGEEVFRRDVELYKKHFPPACLFVNGLGPTESTVSLQNFINQDTEIGRTSVPVGYPVENTEILLLNEAGKKVALYGEIALRSPYLALGYWQKPELTAASFLADPAGGSRRIYRTGDMGRLLPDGKLEFVGRKDFQVKVRGFRLELKEIEAMLNQHPAVQEAFVLAREDQRGEKCLAAYIVPVSGWAVNANDLGDFLGARLPSYMLPVSYVILETPPLTPSGKVDRRALPAPDTTLIRPEKIFVAPRNEVELQLVRLWEQILGHPTISVNDNFFDLGGHSLLAVRLLAQIEQAFDKKLPLATLFQAPTVAQLAKTLRQTEETNVWSSLVALQPNGSKPPFFCLPGNLGNVFVDLGDLAKYLGPDQPVYGLQDGSQNPAQLKALAAHYIDEIQTVQTEGPYLLGGICSGGIIAFEMAQQLVAQGQSVALLALVEPPHPPVLGMRVYFNFSVSILTRVIKRLSYHSVSFWQRAPLERESYARLKAKLMANLWAMIRYTPQIYPGRITLFLADEPVVKSPNDPRLGWREFSTKEMEVQWVPGTHNTITRTQGAIPEQVHLRVLADRLRISIDDAIRRQTE